jgi:hypothetical protein
MEVWLPAGEANIRDAQLPDGQAMTSPGLVRLPQADPPLSRTQRVTVYRPIR